jgi:hypothetical protein
MIAVLLRELLYGWIYRRTIRLPALSSEQRWAIAAGANLAKLNRSSLRSLATGKLPSTNRYILRDSWSIDDPESLRSTMSWLAQEGHRTSFQELYAALAGGGQGLPPEAANSPVVRFVAENRARFKNGDLLAWDLARLINVARFGFSAGYLSEAEAWEVITVAADHLKAEYASWEEVSDNYLLGFSFWQDGAPPDEFLLEAATWLKTDPASPWKALPWRATAQ